MRAIAMAPVRRMPLVALNPAPYNPRKPLAPGDEAFERLARSLEEFGCVEPLVWNARTGHLVGGHQRLAVLRSRGAVEADVCVVDLEPAKEKALNLALNKLSGAWDEQKLAALLDELARAPGLDLGLTGFELGEIAELSRLAPGALGDDASFDVGAALDAHGPAVTQPGELLELGEHRLLCGDATDPESVRRVMGEDRAVLFATDPPYLVGYDGTNHPGGGTRRNRDWSGSYGLTWDDASANPELYDRFIGAAVAHALRPDAAWYCWHASRRQAMLEEVWTRHGAFVHAQIIWVKSRPVLTRTWYAWAHEPCFMGWRSGRRPPRTGQEILSTVWEVASVARGPERPEHPTPKPLELFEIPMRQHTRGGEVCYEPFAGSGSQLIAAERLGRRCRAVEISPRYCDVIVRRWLHSVGPRAPRPLVERYGAPAPRGSGS